MSKVLMFLCFVFTTTLALGQSPKFELKAGNDLYQNKEYDKALDKFNQLGAVEDKSVSQASNFNKANTYYKSEDFENALSAYTKSAVEATDEASKAEALHNLGNTYFKMQKLEESLEAYKKALKLNPADEETRYNYSLVKKLLEQQQQQQDQQDKQDQKQDEKKEDQENQDQENKDEQQDKQDQDQQEEQKQDQQQDQQQQQQEQQKEEQRQKQMKRKNAENLLDALNQQEKGVQRKVNKAKGKGKKVNIEKDW